MTQKRWSGKSIDRQVIKDFLTALGLDPNGVTEMTINPQYLTYITLVRDGDGHTVQDGYSGRLATRMEVIDIND